MNNKAPSILIIEDNIYERKALSDKFVRHGFEVLEADNGQSGLKMALEYKPDIILLDLIMPIMDGLTALKKLREDRWGVEAEVIVLSNLSDGKDVTTAMASGIHDYLIKSNWKIDDLVTKVRDRLSKLKS